MPRHLLLIFLLSFLAFANIPPQITNTPFAKVITESKDDGTTIAYTYGNDLLSDGTHSFLTDALGSTRGLVDNTETLTDSYDYTPYGELSSHIGTSENSFLFTGEQLDKETGNYYLRARYYSPTTTRFLSRDTYDGKLIDPISQNHYLYAGANPVMYVDPNGHMTMMSMSNAIAITGILAGGSIVSLAILNNNRGGYGGDIIFDLMYYNIVNNMKVLYSDIVILAGLAKTPRPMTHDEENKLLRDLERLLGRGGNDVPSCDFLIEARKKLVEIMNWRDQNQNPNDGDIYDRHFERIEWIEEIIEAIDEALETGQCL